MRHGVELPIEERDAFAVGLEVPAAVERIEALRSAAIPEVNGVVLGVDRIAVDGDDRFRRGGSHLAENHGRLAGAFRRQHAHA